MKRVNYHGWQNCYQLSNGHVQLMLTTDVGPRILGDRASAIASIGLPLTDLIGSSSRRKLPH